MKQFLKFTLASIVGVIIATLLGVLVLFGIIGAVAGSKESATELKPNSVYEIKLEGKQINLQSRKQERKGVMERGQVLT